MNEEYTFVDLPWAIVDTKQRKVLARFESRAFAQVSADAISARLGAYRDCVEVVNMGAVVEA